MTEKNENSNISIIILNECTDPRKNHVDFPCGWMTADEKCKWTEKKKCTPMRVDWFILNRLDELKDLKL